MVSRRLIRIKTFQILYSQFSKNEIDFHISYKELQKSISKTQDLYFLILRLVVDLKDYNLERIEINKNKQLASHEDLSPKMAFVENKIITLIEENIQYQRFQSGNYLNWNDHRDVVEKIYKVLINTDTFKSYLNKESRSLKDDKKIISFLLEEIIGNYEDILNVLEEISIYWTEDFEFVVNNILKTVRTFKTTDSDEKLLSEIYKNDDDKEFAYNLLKFVLQNHDESIELIEKHAKNWEIERIIQIDILLMEMALAELTHMPSIPIKVSLDEYIELSKYYSSAKSKIFINGVLDKIIVEQKKKGLISKKGRGLIGQA